MTDTDLSTRAIIDRASQNHPLGRDGKAIASYCQMTLAELCVLQDSLAAETKAREAAEFELIRVRTAQGAAAHALDVLRQSAGLDLIDGEHPADTGKRIGAERDRLRAMIKAATYELDEELQNM